jgi:DNA-directed RNA polymerase subunit K/omega
MVDRNRRPDSFEFVIAAGARAGQLLAGSTPRIVVGEHKKITVVQKEIVTAAVATIKPGPRQ